jgi:hypothetical protein
MVEGRRLGVEYRGSGVYAHVSSVRDSCSVLPYTWHVAFQACYEKAKTTREWLSDSR